MPIVYPCSTNSRARLLLALFPTCALAFAALGGTLRGPADPNPDQAVSETVGLIDGAAITVEGPMQVEVADGVERKVLRSGADVHVKSGQARLELIEGGVISICGPAHFSVLKSGGGLTVALESGTIHAHIEHDPALIIFTPQVQAKPLAIGEGPQDMLVSVEPSGSMCIRAISGAVRIEQQLTGQSTVVPQSGEVQLADGQIGSLRNGGGHCACELQLKNAVPEVSLVASAAEARPRIPPATSTVPSAAGEEPVYQVFMPPLAFDASAKVQPEPDMHLIILVRRVRVRPSLVYRGRVEGAPVNPLAPATAASAAAHGADHKPAPPAKNAGDSVYARIRNYLHQLWTPSH